MKFRVLLISVLLILNLLLPACNGTASTSEPGLKKYEAEFLNLFDTLTQIVGYAQSRETFEAEVQQIKDDLESYHQLYDIYNNYPGLVNLKDINDQAGQGPITVDAKIIDLLRYSRMAYDLTSGKVNIAMGSVLKIWHDYREEGINDPETARVPPLEALR